MALARTIEVNNSSFESSTHPSVEEIVIGRDVLELVSSAMYIDPLTIFREYVQNSADAIDQARTLGLLKASAAGRVEIQINPEARQIKIRDNGAGISSTEFTSRLTALGASVKRGTAARGFRGVGRLAGLGYSQQLIFRSRAAGEKNVSQLVWDCRSMRTALRSASEDRGITDLISRLVSISRIPGQGYPEHFFEAELNGVVRLRSDVLMNSARIAEYLSQVAPVPFAPDFPYSSQIREALGADLSLCDLDIRMSGQDEPIYRPHRKGFSEDKQKCSFEEIEIVKIPGVDGDAAAMGWVIHHEYDGAVPNGAGFKGLRLRVGNVQIGGHSLLEELFVEPRFNSWSIGEIHVVDRRIVPNARRDDFEQGAHYSNLLSQLAPIARAISKRCRTSSKNRQLLRQFQVHDEAVVERLDILAQGGIRREARKAQIAGAESSLDRMTRITQKLEVIDGHSRLLARTNKLRDRIGAQKKEADESPLAVLPSHKRSLYGQMFELIYDCSTNRVAAKALVDRILERVRQEHVSKKPSPKASGRKKRTKSRSYSFKRARMRSKSR